MTPDPVPLVVDLDGSLIHGDSSRQALALLLIHTPWRMVCVLRWWWRGGRARAKAGLFHLRAARISDLRWKPAVLAFVNDQQRQGRRVILATGSDRRMARVVRAHLGLDPLLIASNARINRIGLAKRDALLALFGRNGFDYLGDSNADRHVWSVCRHALVVGERDPGVTCAQRFL